MKNRNENSIRDKKVCEVMVVGLWSFLSQYRGLDHVFAISQNSFPPPPQKKSPNKLKASNIGDYFKDTARWCSSSHSSTWPHTSLCTVSWTVFCVLAVSRHKIWHKINIYQAQKYPGGVKQWWRNDITVKLRYCEDYEIRLYIRHESIFLAFLMIFFIEK